MPQKHILKLSPLASFSHKKPKYYTYLLQGSYVAVSGTPGRGSVHVVDNVPSLGRDSVTVVNGVSVRSRHGTRTALVPVAPPPVAHPAVVAPAPTRGVVQVQTPAVVPVAAVAPQPAPSIATLLLRIANLN